MKTLSYTVRVVLFHLLFINGIQAQTEIQANKLMDALNVKDRTTSFNLVHTVDSVNSVFDSTSLLMKASILGYNGVVKILLEKGAQVNLKNNDGFSALLIACGAGHIDIVKQLLNKGAQVDLQENNGFSALMMAVIARQTEIIKLLLDKGTKAELDLQDWGGFTALMYASINGDTEIVKLLLEKEANHKLTTMTGTTAIKLAKNKEVKSLLKKYK